MTPEQFYIASAVVIIALIVGAVYLYRRDK